MDPLIKTWAGLIALTAATTVLAGFDGRIAAPGLLLLAGLKARLILARFLHLSDAPGWLSAFTVPLFLWLGLIGAVYVITD